MYFYLATALLLLAGCVSAPKQTATFKAEYVADSNSLGHSSQIIEKNLTRSKYNTLLGETVAAYPYSGALIETSVKEKGAKNLDNADKITKDIEKNKQFFTSDKTCFAVRVTATGAIEGAMFKYWVAKVEQPVGTYHEAFFSNISGSESVPELLTATSMGGAWLNSSFVCTKYKVDFTKDYSLNMIPQLGNNGSLRLTWLPEAGPQK